MKECIITKSKKAKAEKTVVIFLGMFNKVLCSIFLNIFMVAIGFGFGFTYTHVMIHQYATQVTKYEYLNQIDACVQQLQDLDQDYTAIQKNIREILHRMETQMAHEKHPFCKSLVGKILIRDNNDLQDISESESQKTKQDLDMR